MANSYTRRINLYINGKEVRDDISSIRKEFVKNTNELARMKVGSEEYNKKLREVGQLKGILDNHTKAIREASGATKENTSLLDKLKNAAGGLLGAFSFAAIAAGAKAAFEKIVSATDTLSTKFNIFTGGLKSGMDEFWRTMATGDFSNFITNMRSAITVGREYERVLDDLEAKQRAMGIAEANSRQEIVSLEEQLRNVGMTPEQRLAAGNRRIQIEEELAARRTKIAQKEYDNEVMLAKQASKLSEERLQELIADNSKETKLQAENLIQLRQQYKKLSDANQVVVGGVKVPGMATPQMNELKSEMASFPAFIASYANDLEKLGNVTDEQLNKVVASYTSLKDAEVSGRESIKRVITMVNSLQAEGKKAGNNGTQTNAKTPTPDLSGALTPAKEEPLDMSWITADIEAEAQRLAEKKASEEEWTEFMKKMADERMQKAIEENDQYLKDLEFQKQIKEAKQQLVSEQIGAFGAVAGALASMFKEGSAAQIAALAIEKGAAIAQIIYQTAIANAKAVAISPLTAGQPWVSINTISAAASIAGIVATTISSFKDKKNNDKQGFYIGGHTGNGGKYEVAGVVHKNEYVIPSEGIENPQLRPFIDFIEVSRKKGSLASLNLGQIIPSISSRQMYSGGYSSNSAQEINTSKLRDWSPYGSGDKAQNEVIKQLVEAVNELKNLKIYASIEDIRKADKNYTEIQNTRGL